MKICLMTNLYGRHARGGAERIVEMEAVALSELGHDVFILTGVPKEESGPANVCAPASDGGCDDPGLDHRIETDRNGLRVIGFHSPNLYFYPDGDRYPWIARLIWHLVDTFGRRGARRAAEFLKDEKPDVVHSHNLMGLGFMVPRMIRKLGMRHIHTVHDVQLLHPSGLLAADNDHAAVSGLGQRMYVRLMKRIFGSPDGVIFPTSFLKRLHLEHGFFAGSSVSVIPNPAPKVIRRDRPRPDPKIVFFVGQLEAHKGVMDIIEAWPGIHEKTGAELLIAGTGKLKKAVSRAADEDATISYLGLLDRRDLSKAYGRASYTVVASSVIENYPTVIMESFSHGTPVIASESGGIPEVVSEKETGFIFSPGDTESMSRKIVAALHDDIDWRAISENCFARAEAGGIRRHIGSVEKLLQA